MKRLLTVLIIMTVMTALVFAGGSGQSSGKNAGGYEKVKMTYATVQAREGYDYNKGDPFAKWWSDKFNYELDVTPLNWDNWSSNLRTWIYANDMPQVAVYNYNHADAAAFVEQGLVYRFPDDWKKRWPNVAKVYDKTTLGPYIEKIFGGTYFIPRARYDFNLPGDPLPNHWSVYIRKDWAKAVGFPIKTTYTINEILDLCRQLKAKDPGKVGSKLVPLALAPQQASRFFLQSSSTYYDTFYKDKDGKYKWGAAAPDTLAGLKLWYEAFSTGLLDREFYLQKTDDDRDKFEVSAVAGVYMGQLPTKEVTARRKAFATNTGLNADDCVHFATVLGNDGYFHERDLINFWGTICFSPKVPKAVFERWMDVMDYASTEEGFAITVLGLKDVDWKKNADGSYASLLPAGVNLTGEPGQSKYPSMGYILGSVILWDDFAFNDPNDPKKYRDESWTLLTERNKYSTPDTFAKVDWTVYTYDSPARRRVNYEYYKEFTNIVTSATNANDLVTKYNAWINSQNGIIQPVLDELNAKK